MKKIFLLFSLVLTICSTAIAQAPSINQIWYTTVDGEKIEMDPNHHDPSEPSAFDQPLIRNEYDASVGQFVLTFDGVVTRIGKGAFRSFGWELKSVTVPCAVTSIEDEAFEGCQELTSITIPCSVVSIGKNAFKNCTGLKSITIPGGVKRIEDSAFKQCYNMTSVTISNGVASIGESAFEGCSMLPSIMLPESITSIGDRAFYGTSSLTKVIVLATNPPVLGNDVFYRGGADLYVPSVETYAASSWNRFFYISPYSPQYTGCKHKALEEINEALQGLELSESETQIMNGFLRQINNVHDDALAETRENFLIIESAKTAALDFVKMLVRDAALTAIAEAMPENANDLVQHQISIINTSNDVAMINMARGVALDILYAYNKVLGYVPTDTTTGPAVRISKKGKTPLTIYNPDKVEFLSK